MKVDVEVAVKSPSEAPELARKAEELGFDCFWCNETKHDPFVQLALAAGNTNRIALGTSIALAFTRSPTTLAYTAWDLQSLSRGRIILGLGSQVKGHIERRFGMKWDPPAPKMKEVVLALRSVWRSWQEGAKLDFQGRFVVLNLMTPFFSPGPIADPEIPVYIAAVNPGMCRVAGAVADGIHVHPLHTVRYLREVIIPSIGRGLTESGRDRGSFSVAASVFAAPGETESDRRKVREMTRGQVAFYASTRSYRRIMDLHRWGDVCDRLHALSSKGEWQKMASEVPDQVLDAFIVEGNWEEMGGALRERYGGLVDRVRLYLPFDGKDEWRTFIRGFRA